MKKALVRITPVKEKGYKNHYWFAYKDSDGYYKYMVTFKVRNGIPIMKNHSVGISHSCYANIDGSGSVAGMRANYGWKNQTVVKAHGYWFNLDRLRIGDPIDAFLHLLKNKFNFDINEFVNREFAIEYEWDQAHITTIKVIEDEPIDRKMLADL